VPSTKEKGRETMDKVRIVFRRILIVMLVIWMISVFGLSNQNGEASGNLSMKVANFFAHGDTVEAENIEPIIRKVAHMTEYAVGGMIFYGITLTYPKLTTKKRVFISVIFAVLYASSDEVHQLYISERNGSIKDVIIDTCGALLGIGGVYIIQNTIRLMDNKVQESLKNNK
jgi:VanZ family protein